MCMRIKKIFIVPIIFVQFLFAKTSFGQSDGFDIGTRIKDTFALTSYWAGFQPDTTFKGDSFIPFMAAYINGLFGLIGIIFLVWIILGGWWWMTASGNEERIDKAKKTILHSSIGLGIIFMARIITNLILIILDKSVAS
jgi:hypothetical protein